MMRDISFFLLKNSLASKMKRGIRSFCNGVGSTSTLNQRRSSSAAAADISCIAAASLTGVSSSSASGSSYPGAEEEEDTVIRRRRSPLTLEEMILQLDLEEEEEAAAAARRARLEDIYYGDLQPYRRMSCVNNSDILRSARNALNQYPRFSLDGRDAMYRSTFRHVGGGDGRRSVCCTGGRDLERDLRLLPRTVAGESVVWCKPGVVAKLMGLDAVPVPLAAGGKRRSGCVAANGTTNNARKQSLKRMGRRELERERLVFGGGGEMRMGRRRRESVGSCSSTAAEYDYCVMRPRSDCRFARAL